MKVNKLSFQTEEEKGTRSPKLWFELVIDGEPIEKFIGEDKAIPHYYFDESENDCFDESEKNLPYEINYEGKKLYLLGVCICGHAGCGREEAELEKGTDFVDLKVFYPSGGYQPPEEIKFKFARENYESVIDKITKLAKEYKEKSENNS